MVIHARLLHQRKARQTTISEFNAAMNNGLYDKVLLYIPEGESGSMLYPIGHNYHIEEIVSRQSQS